VPIKSFCTLEWKARHMAAADSPVNLPTSSNAVDDARPTLLQDKSFWGLAVTQFLGAFNDNLYKQLILLLAVTATGAAGAAAVAEAGAGNAVPPAEASADVQGWALFLFSIPVRAHEWLCRLPIGPL
jgi:hypothetical protein